MLVGGKIDATQEPTRAASDRQQCISKALSLLDEVSTSIPSATPFGWPAAVRRSKLQSPNDGFLTGFPEWQTPYTLSPIAMMSVCHKALGRPDTCC